MGCATANTVLKSNGTTATCSQIFDDGTNVGIGTVTPAYKLEVDHGGATGLLVKSTASFSVVDIDASSGDAALRFVKAGVNQWNTRNRPADNYYEIFELGGGGSRFVIQDATGFVGIGGVDPTALLHTNGTVRMENLAGTGTFVAIDANGNLSKGNPSPTISAFNGLVSTIAASSSVYVFAGPTVTVTLTSTKKITGSAVAQMASTVAGGSFDYGLCYQLGAGTVTHFAGSNYMEGVMGTQRIGWAAAESVTLPAGTYTIGFGVRNSSANTINSNDWMNGWIMVTEP